MKEALRNVLDGDLGSGVSRQQIELWPVRLGGRLVAGVLATIVRLTGKTNGAAESSVTASVLDLRVAPSNLD